MVVDLAARCVYVCACVHAPDLHAWDEDVDVYVVCVVVRGRC